MFESAHHDAHRWHNTRCSHREKSLLFEAGLACPSGEQGIVIFGREGDIEKHTIRIGQTCYIPTPDVLVKSVCILKHSGHVSDRRGVPSSDVLVKSFCIYKHMDMSVTEEVSHPPMSWLKIRSLQT